MSVVEFTQGNFESEVLKSDGIVLVDFWAEWCGPCKMFSPVIDQIAEEGLEGVKVGKVNTDEQPSIAEAYRIMTIPTLIIFKDGQPVKTSVGVQSKNTVIDMINEVK